MSQLKNHLYGLYKDRDKKNKPLKNNSQMKNPKFYISYLVGGYSNFIVKSCNSRHMTKKDAENELLEVRKMGYISMIANTSTGGFECHNSPVFNSGEESEIYYKECLTNYSN